MTTTELPVAALYAVALGWALVRGSFFYGLGALSRRDLSPRWTALTDRVLGSHVGRAVERVGEHGPKAVTATYVIPGLAAATQVVAGMSGMRPRAFAAGFVAAAAPWAVVETVAGAAILAALLSQWGLLFVGGVVLVLALRRLARSRTAESRSGPAPVAA